eukprot:scaffold76461_cov63-Phaeocystis_antarctica.AAC.3
MMYSTTLLVSLLASAHGFASVPTKSPECFFAFSTDQSMVYEAARNLGVVDTKVDDSGLIGKIWAGVSLTITPMGVQSMFSLKLETVTSPNLPPLQGVTAVVSEEFCLEHGTYSVETVCLPTANLQAHTALETLPYPHPTTLLQGEDGAPPSQTNPQP